LNLISNPVPFIKKSICRLIREVQANLVVLRELLWTTVVVQLDNLHSSYFIFDALKEAQKNET